MATVSWIFRGDLAHVAAFHLREKDRVCIDGQLIAEPPPVIHASRCQTNVQVMVHTVKFVEGSSPTARRPYLPNLDDDEDVQLRGDLTGTWSDPEIWQDREKDAEFQPTDVKDMIDKDEFTRVEIPKVLDMMKSNGKFEANVYKKTIENKDDVHWKNLLDNFTQWKDYRDKKKNIANW